MTDLPQYVLRLPDGRWAYHLSAPSGSKGLLRGYYADGTLMEQLAHSTWWVTDHEARRLTARFEPRAALTGYRLKNPAAQSDLFRTEYTLAEWEAQEAVLTDDDCEAMSAFYDAVYEPQQPVEEEIPGQRLILEAEEVPGSAGPWVPSLPSMLVNRPEYHRCFPGYIPGLRDHIKQLTSRMRHVDYCHPSRPGEPQGLSVTITVAFEQPRSHWRPNLGKRGQELKSGREVPTLVTQRMFLPVPDRVHGANYSQAYAEWQAQVDFWVAVIVNANVKACTTCDGRGHVLDANAAAQPR